MTCLLVKIKPFEPITVPEPKNNHLYSLPHNNFTVDFIILSWFISCCELVSVLGLFGGVQFCDVSGGAFSTDGQSYVLLQLLVFIPLGEQELHVLHSQVSALHDGTY